MSKTLPSFLILISLAVLIAVPGCQQQNREGSNALSGKNINQYIAEMENYTTTVDQDNFTFIHISKGVLSPCQENSDGPCGFDLYVFGPSNWMANKGQNQTFFLSAESATGRKFYGPFSDKIENIIDGLKDLEDKYGSAVVLLEDTQYGIKFTTTKGCEKYLKVISVDTESSGATASYVSELVSPIDWSGVLVSYNIFSVDEFNKFSPDSLPGRPRTLLILSEDSLLTQWDPQDMPSSEELPEYCGVKAEKIN